MTALKRIHGAKIPLASLDDRSGSGTPLAATAAITASTSRPATITDTGFVHDSYGNEKGGRGGWFREIHVPRGANRKKGMERNTANSTHPGLAVEGDGGAVAEGQRGVAGGRVAPDPEATAAAGSLGPEGEQRPEAVARLDAAHVEAVPPRARQVRPEDGHRAGAPPVQVHLHGRDALSRRRGRLQWRRSQRFLFRTRHRHPLAAGLLRCSLGNYCDVWMRKILIPGHSFVRQLGQYSVQRDIYVNTFMSCGFQLRSGNTFMSC